MFAANDIPRTADASFPLKTSFNADEPLNARIFLNGSIAKQIGALPDPSHNCKWDNRRRIGPASTRASSSAAPTLIEAHTAGEKSWSYLSSTSVPQTYDGPLIPDKAIVLPNELGSLQANLLLLLTNLPAGTHKLALSQIADCVSNPKLEVAKGEVTIITTAKSRATLAKRLGLARSLMQDTPEATQLRKAATTVFQGAKLRDFRILGGPGTSGRTPPTFPLSRDLLAAADLREGQGLHPRGLQGQRDLRGGGRYGEPQFFDENDTRMGKHVVPCEVAPGK